MNVFVHEVIHVKDGGHSIFRLDGVDRRMTICGIAYSRGVSYERRYAPESEGRRIHEFPPTGTETEEKPTCLLCLTER